MVKNLWTKIFIYNHMLSIEKGCLISITSSPCWVRFIYIRVLLGYCKSDFWLRVSICKMYLGVPYESTSQVRGRQGFRSTHDSQVRTHCQPSHKWIGFELIQSGRGLGQHFHPQLHHHTQNIIGLYCKGLSDFTLPQFIV